MTTKTRQRKSRLGLFLFVAGLTAASWFAFQFFTKAEGGKLAFRPLPYVNYGLEPSNTRAPGARDLVRTSNTLGFRGPEIELPKPASRFRIVCLGGSTTYSDLVNDDETYPVHLERILEQRRPGQDIEVINAGVPSYTSAESLANFMFRCIDLEPDVIVLYQAANDLRTRGYANYDSAYFHYRKVWDGTLDNPTESDLAELRGGINPYIQLDAPATDIPRHELIKRSGTGAYRRNLISMIGAARAHGIETALVTFLIDRGNEYVSDEMVRGIEGYNRAMKEIGERHGATVIDLASTMPYEGMFGDPVHMNAKGTLQKARVVADGLLELVP